MFALTEFSTFCKKKKIVLQFYGVNSPFYTNRSECVSGEGGLPKNTSTCSMVNRWRDLTVDSPFIPSKMPFRVCFSLQFAWIPLSSICSSFASHPYSISPSKASSISAAMFCISSKPCFLLHNFFSTYPIPSPPIPHGTYPSNPPLPPPPVYTHPQKPNVPLSFWLSRCVSYMCCCLAHVVGPQSLLYIWCSCNVFWRCLLPLCSV